VSFLILYATVRLQERLGRPVRFDEVFDATYNIPWVRYSVRFFDSEYEWWEAFEKLVKRGYLEGVNGAYTATEKGRAAVRRLSRDGHVRLIDAAIRLY